MRITSQMITNNAIQNMNDNLEKLHKIQSRTSNGKAFEKSSDDPVNASLSMSLRSGLKTLQNYIDTSKVVTDWMSASDFALQQTEDITNQALNLVTRGLNDTLDASTRKNALKPEMDELISQTLEMANSQQNGQYIFSGFKTDTAPFKIIDHTNDPVPPVPPAVAWVPDAVTGMTEVQYNGDTNIMKRAINPSSNPSQTVDQNVTGDKAFLNLLKNLIQAKNALDTNDTTTLRTSLGGIQSSLDQELSTSRTSNGARIRQTELVGEYLGKAQIEATSLLSQKEDINMAEGITQLQSQTTTYQAVLEVSQRAISTMNLFDYMN
jgi:flagellar hook-associated protein 3 FlgL